MAPYIMRIYVDEIVDFATQNCSVTLSYSFSK